MPKSCLDAVRLTSEGNKSFWPAHDKGTPNFSEASMKPCSPGVKPVEAFVRIKGVWEPGKDGWSLFRDDNVHGRFGLPHLGLGLLRQRGLIQECNGF
jgi:hypothetical protein